MADGKMRLGMFYWPGGGQHMAAWRHPEGHPDFDADVNKIIELAKLSERGLFDMFFMADTLTFWRGSLEAMSRDAAGSFIDPVTVMAMASGERPTEAGSETAAAAASLLAGVATEGATSTR